MDEAGDDMNEFITETMAEAVNKIILENTRGSAPEYEMKRVKEEWMVFIKSDWCYMPLKDGIEKVNKMVNKPLSEYGLNSFEVKAYAELLSLLEITPNPAAKIQEV